jgi:hypothetical protein
MLSILYRGFLRGLSHADSFNGGDGSIQKRQVEAGKPRLPKIKDAYSG